MLRWLVSFVSYPRGSRVTLIRRIKGVGRLLPSPFNSFLFKSHGGTLESGF